MKRYLFCAAIVLTLLLTSCGQPAATAGNEMGSIDKAVDEQIQALMEEGKIRSLAASIVVNDSLLWTKGYGKQPDLDTVYGLGSIAKPFVATAVLQLYERGAFDLDDERDGRPQERCAVLRRIYRSS